MLTKLIDENPDRKFVLSTTTVTGQQLARDRAPEEVTVIFCPIDCHFFINRLLRLLQPAMLVVLETEIWPNMILCSKSKGVKLALVNARISDRSYKGYYRWRMFFRPLLEAFDFIGAQSEVDAKRYATVAPEANISVTGNMKFDQEVPKHLPAIDLTEFFGTEPFTVLLGASTHPGEERLLIETFNKLKHCGTFARTNIHYRKRF